MIKLDCEIHNQFHQIIQYVMVTGASTESYYKSEDDYSIITMDYFDQFNQKISLV